MSHEDGFWVAPNQDHGLSRQLADGVRALMLDTHEYRGEAFLCHEICPLGSQRLVDGLDEIRRFLDSNRGEVLSVIFESYLGAAATRAAFARSGLDRYLATLPSDGTFPTLRELIASDRRLVVFTDKEGGAFPGYHDLWKYAWETPFSVEQAADFGCRHNRGAAGGPLLILNHFLSAPLASRSLARLANAAPSLLEHARACGRRPSFVAVDFYATGDLFAAVRALNNLAVEKDLPIR